MWMLSLRRTKKFVGGADQTWDKEEFITLSFRPSADLMVRIGKEFSERANSKVKLEYLNAFVLLHLCGKWEGECVCVGIRELLG